MMDIIEKLATRITAKPETRKIIITRSFDTPRELAFKVWIDPNGIPHWWELEKLMTTIDAWWSSSATYGGSSSVIPAVSLCVP